MPQASDDLRKLVHWIVQSKSELVPDDSEVCEYLKNKGYRLTNEYEWKMPKFIEKEKKK